MAAKEDIYRLGNHSFRKECPELPIQVNSNNVITLTSFKKQLDSTFVSVAFQFILIVLINLIIHFLFKRLPFSKLVTFIIAGISFAGIKSLLNKENAQYVISPGGEQILGTFTQLGYMMFLFTIGVKMDMKMIVTTGRKALAVGVVALIAPLISVLVFIAVVAVSSDILKESDLLFRLANVGVLHSLSTFPVISYLLHELEIINSELGRLALSSAVISELLSMFILTIATTLVVRDENSATAGTQTDSSTAKVIVLAVFLVSAVFVVRPAMFWIIRRTPEGRPVKDGYVMMIIIGVLLSSLLSDWFDQFVLFAPYILGLAMPDGPPLGSALVNKLETFMSGFLVPVFITSCASKLVYVSFKNVADDPEIYLSIGLIILTFGVKLVACLITTVLGFSMPWKDGLALAFIMSAKGIVEMATYTFLGDSERISKECFTVILYTIMISAGMTPMIVKRLYDTSKKYAGYQKRNIAILRSNEELRILVCIHRADNISSSIKLLDVSSPTKETPISVSVLHLIELVGRTTPIFISHQHQRIISEHSYSKNVIMAFDEYQGLKGSDALSVQMFTAVSPPKLMQEDIGTLALNKLTSLIVMPFHRKWSPDGTLESENHNIRALNCSVLDRAPCSVGILIDRTRMVSSSSTPAMHRIAMIFIGGGDDREAFAYAKRMAKGSSLTVIKVADSDREGEKKWDWMVDSEVLKEVKMGRLQGVRHVDYREEVVVDGPETATRIRRIVKDDDFDLIVVGRRFGVECNQTSGLMEWTEFPELGVLGDLLASTDLESGSSVLVVQSQRVAVK